MGKKRDALHQAALKGGLVISKDKSCPGLSLSLGATVPQNSRSTSVLSPRLNVHHISYGNWRHFVLDEPSG